MAKRRNDVIRALNKRKRHLVVSLVLKSSVARMSTSDCYMDNNPEKPSDEEGQN